MKKAKKVLAVIIGLCILLSIVWTGSGENVSAIEKGSGGSVYAPGEIIVVFEEGVSLKKAETTVEMLGADDSEVLSRFGNQIAEIVTLSEEQDVEEVIENYNDNPDIAYAQPNYRYMLKDNARQATLFSTNDVYYTNLWHFNKIHLEEAWDILNQAKHAKVKVAVLDTGVDLSHPDLQRNLNKALCKDTSSGTTTTNLTGDLGSHGTHVSGIVAATANNNMGVAGVGSGVDNSAVSLFVIKVFRSDGYAYSDGLVRGIEYAKNNGAKVINMSLGYATAAPMDEDDKYIKSACDAVVSKGITVVCAGGNDGGKPAWETKPNYPADFDACISVVSTDQGNQKSGFSSYGEGKNISAPGSNIYSTMPGGNFYGSKNGTSMASPVVAGVSALLYSLDNELSADHIKYLLYTTATDIYSTGWDEFSGWGIVNAEAALQQRLKEDKITYVLNDGINARDNPLFYNENSSFPIRINRPAKEGDAFKGWTVKYANSGISNITKAVKTYSITKNITGDIKLTAKWEKVTVGKTKIKSLKRLSRQTIKVTYKRVSGANGYQITYASNKKFHKKKTVTTKNTSKILSRLKEGKNCYVKVRAWKYDSAGKRIYGRYCVVDSN